jgi:hypothetical protein
MSVEFVRSNMNNILFLILLIFGLMLHLFLGELIFDILNLESLVILLLIMIIIFTLHFTLGRKLFHSGGLTE